MEEPRPIPVEAVTQAPASPPRYLPVREEFAYRFLSGEGLEIGALHMPLPVPPQARVRQVDRMPVEELRRHYPEIAALPLQPVDVVDDGETLATIAPESQDFIVANHFLEHTADPIGTIETHLGKLRPGGVLFYAVPDKRFSFDFRRPVTPLEHMVRDHEQGPEGSRRQHYEEWARFVASTDEERAAEGFEELVADRARELDAADYSIHTHVWTQASFLGLLLLCRERFEEAFDIEAVAQCSLELVVVLRKRGAWPQPAEPDASIAELRREMARLERHGDRAQSELVAATQALRAVEASPSWRLTKPLRWLKSRLGR
jgi:SAM-dependent methyltransferase